METHERREPIPHARGLHEGFVFEIFFEGDHDQQPSLAKGRRISQ